jgi:hypothetical protein
MKHINLFMLILFSITTSSTYFSRMKWCYYYYVGDFIMHCVFQILGCLQMKVVPRWTEFLVSSSLLQFNFQHTWQMKFEPKMNKHQSQKSRAEIREPPLCKVKKLALKVVLAYLTCCLEPPIHSPHAILFTFTFLHNSYSTVIPSFLVQPCLFA